MRNQEQVVEMTAFYFSRLLPGKQLMGSIDRNK
jgi:hypothetical protein